MAKPDGIRVVTLTEQQIEAMIERAASEGAARASAPEVLRTAEAARLLGFHPRTLLAMLADEGIPHHRVRSEIRFRRSELLAWLSAQPARTGEVA